MVCELGISKCRDWSSGEFGREGSAVGTADSFAPPQALARTSTSRRSRSVEGPTRVSVPTGRLGPPRVAVATGIDRWERSSAERNPCGERPAVPLLAYAHGTPCPYGSTSEVPPGGSHDRVRAGDETWPVTGVPGSVSWSRADFDDPAPTAGSPTKRPPSQALGGTQIPTTRTAEKHRVRATRASPILPSARRTNRNALIAISL